MSSNTADHFTGESSDSTMWYGECPPSECCTRLTTTRIPDRVVQYYPRWRQCLYLPLSRGTEYAYGLTVYVDFAIKCIRSIVSHFESSDFVLGEALWEEEYVKPGYGVAVPIHFALSKGEYLTSAWLYMESFNEPMKDGSLAVSPCPSSMN